MLLLPLTSDVQVWGLQDGAVQAVPHVLADRV